MESTYCHNTVKNNLNHPFYNTIEKDTPSFLEYLPPSFLPSDEFLEKFTLGDTTTEQSNTITERLSQTMHKNIEEGLKQLLDVDAEAIKGVKQWIPVINRLAPDLSQRLLERGRIFFVGSGSSGRAGIDIAAQCHTGFPSYKNQIRGVIAGGDSAMIRAKEGFEDSIQDGEKAMEALSLTDRDVVVLISASGSASFNVGAGHAAANRNARVLYFYNSVNVPDRTKELFTRTNNPVEPLCIDVGPQAICGSTRLQGATLAEACLGSLFVSTCFRSQGKMAQAENYPLELIASMERSIDQIQQLFPQLKALVEAESAILLNSHANFRRVRDETSYGYVTFITSGSSIRPVVIDTVETSPTFSTNPVRREDEGSKRKREEFRAYVLDENTNLRAWEKLLGRPVNSNDCLDTSQFVLSTSAQGEHSFSNRPVGDGNLVIAVTDQLSDQLIALLHSIKAKGGRTGLIFTPRQMSASLPRNLVDFPVVIRDVPQDGIGLSSTILMKQVLHLISNGVMIQTNKVHGNRMVDMRAANNKLIDRSMRLIREILGSTIDDVSQSDLYHYVVHSNVHKKEYEAQGIYTPAIVKIVCCMLIAHKTPEEFQEVIDLLAQCNENLEVVSRLFRNI